MRVFSTLFVLVLCSTCLLGQKPAASKPPVSRKSTVSKAARPKPAPTPTDPALEKSRFDEAIAAASAAERVSALKRFTVEFPESEFRSRAVESLVGARAALGDEKLVASEAADGIAMFKLAVEEAPTPISDRLFAEIISKFPTNLFFRGQPAAAIDVATMIEKKAEGNTFQLLALASYYISVENGDEAKRLSEAVLKIEPSSAAYQTLGLAHRLNFNLDESANAYTKALEIDPGSVAAKRSLAEMKRALGKADEAAALYREIIAKNEADLPARTGLILSLFASGKRDEAESEMTKSLERTPGNLQLLAGAAYWFAGHGDGAKAAELAQKAIDTDPRFIWSHIALARGLISSGKPVDAERVLVQARQYGNFPTLEYEVAAARLAAGFFREAAEELRKSFVLREGMIQTKLGGRVSREDKSLSDLVSYERKASIFEPASADDAETAAKLKSLLELNTKLESATPSEAEISSAVDDFVAGHDKMKLHRQLYAANLLLQKKTALPKVLELTKAAVGNTDASLDVAAPAAAVMAGELYESRSIAFSRNEIILVPDIPRPTLSAILRGRIEELAGWTLYHQGNYPDSIVRLRRAISVYPDKSAWWRSGMWRLGAALEADGKDKEALESYIRSYKTDKPDVLRYGVVEALYKKVNGGTDGLETQIGSNPLAAFTIQTQAKETETPNALRTALAAKPETAGEKERASPQAEAETEATPRVPRSLPVQMPEPKIEPIKSAETVTEASKEAPVEKQSDATKEPPLNKEAPPEAQTVEIKEKEQEAPAEKQAEESKVVKAEPEEPNKEVPAEKKTERPLERTSETAAKNKKAVPETTPELLTADQKAQENDVTANTAEKKSPDSPPDTILPTETDKKSAVQETAATNNSASKPQSSPKSLFEPIVITVPKSELIKLRTATDGANRPRLVDGKEVTVDGTVPCSINVSQENISVLTNGGSLGVLVDVDPEAEIKNVTGTSNSPKDVEVVLEPEIGGVSGRRFFIIRSIGAEPGVYQVTFEALCGKKEIIVNVR